MNTLGNYLKDENHLIVWPVLKETYYNDLCICNLVMRARYDMTTNELLEACLDTYQVDKEKDYELILNRADGDKAVPMNISVREAGLRNGDYLTVVSA